MKTHDKKWYRLDNAAKLYQMSAGQFPIPIVFRGPGGPAAVSASDLEKETLAQDDTEKKVLATLKEMMVGLSLRGPDGAQSLLGFGLSRHRNRGAAG